MKKILIPLSLCLLVLLAFSPCLSAGFLHWDDSNHIVTNPLVYTLNPQTLCRIFAQTINETYIPLTILSYNIGYHIFGLAPWTVHLGNLLGHAILAVLIFQLALRLGVSTTAAWIASAFFSLHPMHVESVAWATERKDVLYAIFYLLALLQYWDYLNKGRNKNYWLALIFGILSVLSKSMAVSLPWILLLLDYFKGRRLDKMAIIDKIPFALIIFPIAAITFFTLSPHPKLIFPESLLILIWSATFYLQKFFWPYPLLPLYTPPEPVALSNPIYAGAVLTLFLFVSLCVMLRRNRWWVFASLFYAGSIFFFWRFDFKDLNIVADRFMYLPSLGFCLAWGVLAARWIDNQRLRHMGIIAVSLILFTLGNLTFLQCQLWQNDAMLWQWTVDHEPHNITARKKRIPTPFQRSSFEKTFAFDPQMLKEPTTSKAYVERAIYFIKNNNGRLAFWDLDQAIKLDARNDMAYDNRGGLYQLKGKYTQALADFEQAITLAPDKGMHYINKAITLVNMNRRDEALAFYNQGLRKDPTLIDGYYRRGLLLRQSNQCPLAIADFTQTIALNNNHREAHYYRGLCFALLKDAPKAIADFKQVLRINPWDSDGYNELGSVYIQTGQWPQALDAFNRVIDLELYDPKPYNNRAMVNLQLNHYPQALDDYSQAIRLDHEPYYSLISRGDLYAVMGQEHKALADYTRAMAINSDDTIAVLKRASLYYKLGRFQQALKDIRSLLAHDPLNEAAHQGETDVLRAINRDR